MSLSSFVFLIFIVCTLGLYYLVPKKLQWMVLLAASIVFYLSCNAKAALYLGITIVFTYSAALWLGRLNTKQDAALAVCENSRQGNIRLQWQRKKRTVLSAVLVLNFFTLFLFKYLNWFILSCNTVFPKSGMVLQPLDLLLPLGISFYIFQTSSYLLDVNRGKVKPEKNLLKYALFVSYFPQMVQGPINRFQALEGQLLSPHPFRTEAIRDGVELMLWGMLKKVLIADTLAPGVSELYANYSSYNGIVVFFGAALYCLQLYCDFSGGIDMMRGVSAMFDIELAENFRRPYFSESVDEFWRRWHMSLGDWMKDYVFYPLALSKCLSRFCKKLRKHMGPKVGKLLPPCISTIVVFLLVGIWQGPGLQNVAYGLWNGLIMSASMLLSALIVRKKRNSRLHRLLRILRTCLLVTIGRFFSNAASLSAAIGMLRHSITTCIWKLSFDGFVSFGLGIKDYLVVLIFGLILFFVSYQQEKGVHIRQALAKKSLYVQFLVLFAAVFTLLVTVYLNSDYTAIAYVYENV